MVHFCRNFSSKRFKNYPNSILQTHIRSTPLVYHFFKSVLFLMLYLSHPASYTEVLSVYLAIVRHMPYSFLCFYQSSFLHGLCSSILRFQIYKSIICIREWERDLKNKNKDHGTFLFLRRRKQPIL